MANQDPYEWSPAPPGEEVLLVRVGFKHYAERGSDKGTRAWLICTDELQVLEWFRLNEWECHWDDWLEETTSHSAEGVDQDRLDSAGITVDERGDMCGPTLVIRALARKGMSRSSFRKETPSP